MVMLSSRYIIPLQSWFLPFYPDMSSIETLKPENAVEKWRCCERN